MRACLLPAALSALALVLLGGPGSCSESPEAAKGAADSELSAGGTADAPAPAPDAPVPDAPAPDAPAPDAPAPDAPAQKQSDRIAFVPPAPKSGEKLEVRAGPITFNNGCQGIASTEAKRAGDRIEVSFARKVVPPDMMCTMALHEQWVSAELEGLPAGTYTVVVQEVGEKKLTIEP